MARTMRKVEFCITENTVKKYSMSIPEAAIDADDPEQSIKDYVADLSPEELEEGRILGDENEDSEWYVSDVVL